VSTAYYSTGISTIEVYAGGSKSVKQIQQLYRLRRLIGRGPVQSDAVMLCTTKKSRLKQYGLAHLLLSIFATHPILEQMPPLPTAHMRLSPLAQLLDAQPLA